MRRVLLCSVGLSPQVVTETLFVLALEQQWVPDQLVLLTTRKGAGVCRELLLDPREGALAAFGKDWEQPWAARLAAAARLEVVETDAGDVNDPRAARQMMDRVAALLGELAADPDTSLHVSVAGGRKPMAAVLALGMALFGRSTDRLSHVLVDEDLVGNSAFFYPPPAPRKIAVADGRIIDLSRAKVALFDIPFPSLRGLLPGGQQGWAETVAAAMAALRPPARRLRIEKGDGPARITWDGAPLRLPPAQAAWLTWLAADRARGGDGLPRVGASREEYLYYYALFAPRARVVGARARLPDPLDPEWMEEKAARIAKLVAGCGISPAGACLIRRRGPRAHARYVLALDPGQTDLAGIPAPAPFWKEARR